MTIQERIRKVRKNNQLNQTDFGARIGVKQTTIAGYETGAKNPLDAVIIAICKEFNVNEKWLRTGEGEMLAEPIEDNLIAKATKLLGEHDPFFEVLVYMYSELSPESRNVMLEKGAALFAEALKRKNEKE